MLHSKPSLLDRNIQATHFLSLRMYEIFFLKKRNAFITFQPFLSCAFKKFTLK